MEDVVFIFGVVMGFVFGACIFGFGNTNVQFSKQDAVKYKIGYYSTTTGAFELNKEFR